MIIGKVQLQTLSELKSSDIGPSSIHWFKLLPKSATASLSSDTPPLIFIFSSFEPVGAKKKQGVELGTETRRVGGQILGSIQKTRKKSTPLLTKFHKEIHKAPSSTITLGTKNSRQIHLKDPQLAWRVSKKLVRKP